MSVIAAKCEKIVLGMRANQHDSDEKKGESWTCFKSLFMFKDN